MGCEAYKDYVKLVGHQLYYSSDKKFATMKKVIKLLLYSDMNIIKNATSLAKMSLNEHENEENIQKEKEK